MTNTVDSDLTWFTPHADPFRISGFAWPDGERVFRRLPVHPAHPLPESVDRLANCTAGGQIRFTTTSGSLGLRFTLRGPANMDHMPATGQCGFDVYLGPAGTAPRYACTTRLAHGKTDFDLTLLTGLDPVRREFVINMPLYQGVSELQIGLAAGAAPAAPSPRRHPHPIIVYGTSITQGGCTARPGMAYTNIVSRMLNLDIVNLGFSGSGRGEPEVAHILASVPQPLMYVLDYEANCGSLESYRQTLPEFVRILRDRHPSVPIVVVSRIIYAAELRDPRALEQRLARLDFQSKLVRDLREEGDKALHFVDGSVFLGSAFPEECTVDGVHPTDLGFKLIAAGLAPEIERILHPQPQV